jgi:hypothetical protein
MSQSKNCLNVRIRHVLKDGREVESVSGRVVKMSDCPTVYSLMDSIRREQYEKIN